MNNKLNFLSIENRDDQGNVIFDFFINGKRLSKKDWESLLEDYFEKNNSDINNIENLNLNNSCLEDDCCLKCEKIKNIIDMLKELDDEEAFDFLNEVFDEYERNIQEVYKQGGLDMCFNFIEISNNLARQVNDL